MAKLLQTRTVRLSAFSTLLFLLFGLCDCSDKLKEMAESPSQKEQQLEVDALNSWCNSLSFVKNANSQSNNLVAGGSPVSNVLKLDWTNVIKRERPNGLGKLWLVPVKRARTIQTSSSSEIGERFVLFYKNLAISASIVEVIAEPSTNLREQVANLTEDILTGIPQPRSPFKGVIIVYNLQYKYLHGIKYIPGQPTLTGVRIERITTNSTPTTNNSADPKGPHALYVTDADADGNCGSSCAMFRVQTTLSNDAYCDCPEPGNGAGGVGGNGSSGGSDGGYGPGQGGYSTGNGGYSGGYGGSDGGGGGGGGVYGGSGGGNTDTGGPPVPDPGWGGTPTPIISAVGDFVMSTQDQTDFPRLTALVQNIPTWVNSTPAMMSLLVKYTGLTEQQITNKLAFGNGPLIVIKNLDRGYGSFNHQQPNSVNIDFQIAVQYETAPIYNTSANQSLNLLLAVTALHEFIHYADFQTGTHFTRVVDMGFAWEKAQFGVEVDINNSYYIYLGLLNP